MVPKNKGETALWYPYLSVDPESASIFLQLNCCNSWDFPGLLDVTTMCSYGESH